MAPTMARSGATGNAAGAAVTGTLLANRLANKPSHNKGRVRESGRYCVS